MKDFSDFGLYYSDFLSWILRPNNYRGGFFAIRGHPITHHPSFRFPAHFYVPFLSSFLTKNVFYEEVFDYSHCCRIDMYC